METRREIFCIWTPISITMCAKLVLLTCCYMILMLLNYILFSMFGGNFVLPFFYSFCFGRSYCDTRRCVSSYISLGCSISVWGIFFITVVKLLIACVFDHIYNNKNKIDSEVWNVCHSWKWTIILKQKMNHYVYVLFKHKMKIPNHYSIFQFFY